MKKTIKIISLTLISAFLFSSCNGKETETEVNGAVDDYEGPGIHQVSYTDTGEYIVERGRSEYKIVVPKDAYDYEIKAAELVQTYLRESTNILLPIVESTGGEKNGDKYISIGDTHLMRNSGISVAYSQLDSDGFKIVTKEDTVYISGSRNGDRSGTYYGAQDFLKYSINWRAYTDECVYYDSLVSVKLYDFDVIERPDFTTREVSFTNITESETWVDYTRMSTNTIERLPFSGHSHFTILPPETYYDAHPDWYTHEDDNAPATTVNADTHQLCWSNDEMAEEFAYQLAQWFFKYPDANFANLGAEDNGNFCTCSKCEGYIEKYKKSGLQVIFTNKIAKRTQELIYQVQPNRDIYVQCFAYSQYVEPPVYYKNGEWLPISEDVVPVSNVYIRFTPLGMNTSEILDSKLNEKYNEYFAGWCAIAKNLSSWIYAINFNYIMINHKNWDTIEANLRYLADNGVDKIVDQGANHYYVNTLPELRVWVESKLMWDLSQNYSQLAEEFIAHYYGEASENIQKMWNLMTSQNEYARTELGMTGWHRLMISDSKYWPFAYVESVRKVMEAAFEDIEPLKATDPERYETMYWRVSSAYYENIYMQMEFYISEYSQAYAESMIDFFEEITDYRQSIQSTEYASSSMYNHITKWRAVYA